MDGPTTTGRTGLARLVSDETQLPLALAAGITLLAGFLLAWMSPETVVGQIGRVLLWVSLGLGAVHGLHAAWEAIRELRPDIDVLMVVGAGLSAAIGHPAEGALLLFMFTLAGALEHRAMEKTRDAVSRLNKLMPRDALIRTGVGWAPTDPESLKPGDEVLVRPGETIPADGVVIVGRSSVDQSTLTGESLPRAVTEDEEVFAGTLNQDGALEIRVTRPVGESSLQRILDLVLEAHESRQPVQRVIDRFSTPYTLTVMVVAVAALIGFVVVAELSATAAAYRAITLLVVASPCALVISTPTATLCGLSRAARAGVLIKGGDALERLSNVSRIVMDKTGTLTKGQIEVMHVHPVAAADTDALLSIAFGAEEQSTHPIAAAIVRLARERRLRPADVAAIQNVPGSGIEGRSGERRLRIGAFDFCEPLIPVCFRRHTERMVDQIRADGGIPVVIAHEDGAMVLALADQPRAGAQQLRERLRSVGVDRMAMLTGDHPVIAERLAAELGIDRVEADLLPEEKVDRIRSMRENEGGGGLAVVGDGVNDAPALAVADVGLAMGRIGADAALETADVILLHDDLDRIPWSFGLARRVKRVMIANLALATLVIAVLAVLTILGRVPLYIGVLGHEGSTLIVVANSLRLLAHPPPSPQLSPAASPPRQGRPASASAVAR
ncbi:MAG: cation-translocating P-type ATPase [Phycisphaerales bacterium]|nr:cation-translocating P-type ATPase [Phycisphaerales bacterium]